MFVFSFSEILIMNKLDIFCLSSLFFSPLFLPYFSHSWNKGKIGSEKKERRADYIWLCKCFGFFYVAQMVKKPPAMQETPVQPLGWEDLLEEGMASTPVFFPGESHEQRSPAGCSPWDHKRVRHDLATKQQHVFSLTGDSLNFFLLASPISKIHSFLWSFRKVWIVRIVFSSLGYWGVNWSCWFVIYLFYFPT